MAFTDIWTIRPQPADGAVIRGDGFRVTVLTERLLRLEYDARERFRDDATQAVIDREFPLPEFTVRRERGWLTVETEAVRLEYDQRPFTPEGLSVTLKGQYSHYASVWHYGDAGRNLKGTARTLDEANGEIPLEDGLISIEGYAVLDDSASMTMDGDGALHPAEPHGEDIYLFAYGHDYRAALKDFFHLTGPAPALPRYALGNWWSRFYPYTQDGYMALMERFAAENVPLSVAVLDMNWHVTDIEAKYGPGWTGYTWNRELIPDPAALLKWLHERGLKVTLNDHPADGVRACEEMYPDMAGTMGVDPKSGAPLKFDAADADYLAAFERHVLEPCEAMGVDFWWIDWQQKGGSSVPGMDPLFTLNHTRYLHAARDGATGLTFSRYGGPGSHRYPVGFSGDSHITWESLAFQPYFTATAANIGYGWWSHDIGGHMHGTRDDELATRWLQFGVFSPIMRLHSSPSEFMRKEPWTYSQPACAAMEKFLRLRHALVPWLYTRNVQGSAEGSPIITPVYYDWPNDWEAYRAQRSEYLLGGELLVCPITSPADADTALAAVDAWLPEGEWVDFFTGWRYPGGQRVRLHRPLDGMPVFARPGTVIPMDGMEAPENGCPLPRVLKFRAFAGAAGEGCALEDNGMRPGSAGYRSVKTTCRIRRDEGFSIAIDIAGDASLVPEDRKLVVELVGVGNAAPDRASCGYGASYDEGVRTLTLELDAKPGEAVTLAWNAVPECPPLDRMALLERRLMPVRVLNDDKDYLMGCARRLSASAQRIMAYQCVGISDKLLSALLELELIQ